MTFLLFNLQVRIQQNTNLCVRLYVCVCVCVCVCVYNHRLYWSAEVRYCVQHNFTKFNERMDLVSQVLTTVWLYVLHFKFFFKYPKLFNKRNHYKIR